MALDRVTVGKVTKRYGHHRALAGVNVTLEAGRVTALLGPNGAGKTTLLGILSTLVRQTAGDVAYFEGTAARAQDDALRREIGVLAHASLCYGELDAIENLRFFGKLYDLADLDARVTALLDEVGLEPKARTRAARTYSRGMMQRLASVKQQGAIVVVVTHDLEAIAGITDHVVVLRRGAIAFEDRRAEGGYGYDELKQVYHAHAE